MHIYIYIYVNHLFIMLFVSFLFWLSIFCGLFPLLKGGLNISFCVSFGLVMFKGERGKPSTCLFDTQGTSWTYPYEPSLVACSIPPT